MTLSHYTLRQRLGSRQKSFGAGITTPKGKYLGYKFLCVGKFGASSPKSQYIMGSNCLKVVLGKAIVDNKGIKDS